MSTSGATDATTCRRPSPAPALGDEHAAPARSPRTARATVARRADISSSLPPTCKLLQLLLAAGAATCGPASEGCRLPPCAEDALQRHRDLAAGASRPGAVHERFDQVDVGAGGRDEGVDRLGCGIRITGGAQPLDRRDLRGLGRHRDLEDRERVLARLLERVDADLQEVARLHPALL